MKHSHLKKADKYVVGGGVTNSLCPRQYDTKPSAGIIAHGVGMISAHSVGVSLGRRQWYGPKPLTIVVNGKHKASAETEAK
jgi:hypothetical protein